MAFFIPTMQLGGAEKEVSNLLKYFSHIHEVYLILMSKNILHEIPKNVHIIFLEQTSQQESYFLKFLKLPILSLKLKNICQKYEIDTLLSFLTRPNYIAVLSKFFNNNSKIIINERSTPSFIYSSNLSGFINRFLIKRLFFRADQIFANSKGAKEDLEKNYGCKNVFVFYNPLDLEFINSVKPIKRVDKKPIFITIGRLDEGKNHTLAISAMKQVDGVLYIIGDGVLKKRLSSQIKKDGLEHKVFLLGSKKNPYKELKSADIFILTSLYEGFPTVILEALACGLPVISSDCNSGPREILATDEKSEFKNSFEIQKYGILTKLNDKNSLIDAMNFLLKNDIIKNSLRLNAKKRAEKFDMKISLKHLNDIIN